MSNPVFNKNLPLLCAHVFQQVNGSYGKGNWEEARVHTRMRNGQLSIEIVVTTTTSTDNNNQEIFRFVPDYEGSPKLAEIIQALWSQNGADDMGAPWGAMHFHVYKDCKMRPFFDPVEEQHLESSDQEEKDSAYMSQVYDNRMELYAKKFRNGEPLADVIIKMQNLFGVWPMGGLVAFQSSTALENDCHVMSTFGLTNPDMPANMTSSPAPKGGFFWNAKETPPLPRIGMAGYGYEFLIMTREPADWAKFLLNAACNNQLLGDVDFLSSVEALGAVTMGNMPAGDDKEVSVLMRETEKIPGEQLVNGKMKFLVITVITEEEVKYRLEHGLEALVELLDKNGVGHISDLDRPSAV